MTVPFMRAYTERLVKICHKHGAHAMGGMSAFIPSRHDEEINKRALSQVRKDKEREVADGFDGTWVAHPDLVQVRKVMMMVMIMVVMVESVIVMIGVVIMMVMSIVLFQVAREVFVQGMNNADHQKHRLKEDVNVEIDDLMTIKVQGGKITEEGVRMNTSVALNYIHVWLQVCWNLFLVTDQG